MVQIVLIRPGSTDFDLQGRIQGNLDIPLCDEGRVQVKLALDDLRAMGLTAIYCAPCEAATETAGIIGSALRIKVKPIEGLRNLDQGLWQGMLIEDVKHKQPKVYRQWQEQPENVCPPDGEMLNEAAERVDEAIEKLIRKNRDGAVGVVVPEPLASLVANRLHGGDIGDLWKAHNDCKCCQQFNIQANSWRSENSFSSTQVKAIPTNGNS